MSLLRSRTVATESTKAFTLIELLTVIATIAILAVLIFPAIERGSANAKKAACMSNLRQLGGALIQYTGENQNILPYRAITPPESMYSFPWHGALARQALGSYLDPASKVYFCPSNRNPEFAPSADSSFWGFCARFTGEKLLTYMQKAPIPGYAGRDDPLIWDVSYYDWGDERAVYCNHQGKRGRNPALGQNAIFGDGHLEWIPASDARFIGSR